MMLRVRNLDLVRNSLRQKEKNLKQGSKTTLQEVAQFGLQMEQSLAPEYSGELKSKIIAFPESEEIWVIRSNPTNDGFPLNVAFDNGNFGDMTMFGPGGVRVPFVPRDINSIGFAQNTAKLLDEELSRKLKIMVSRVVRS